MSTHVNSIAVIEGSLTVAFDDESSDEEEDEDDFLNKEIPNERNRVYADISDDEEELETFPKETQKENSQNPLEPSENSLANAMMKSVNTVEAFGSTIQKHEVASEQKKSSQSTVTKNSNTVPEQNVKSEGKRVV